jgi:hypothetical protein
MCLAVEIDKISHASETALNDNIDFNSLHFWVLESSSNSNADNLDKCVLILLAIKHTNTATPTATAIGSSTENEENEIYSLDFKVNCGKLSVNTRRRHGVVEKERGKYFICPQCRLQRGVLS